MLNIRIEPYGVVKQLDVRELTELRNLCDQRLNEINNIKLNEQEQMMAQKDKMQAINMLRDRTGYNLKLCKELVDRYQFLLQYCTS